MSLENEYVINTLKRNAVFALNDHEVRKTAKMSQQQSQSQMAPKTQFLVENLLEKVNKRVSDLTLEIVFFSDSIRNYSIKQILAEMILRK